MFEHYLNNFKLNNDYSYETVYKIKEELFEKYNIDIIIKKCKMFDFHNSKPNNQIYKTHYNVEILDNKKQIKLPLNACYEFNKEIECVIYSINYSIDNLIKS